jgi:hypothetical protein
MGDPMQANRFAPNLDATALAQLERGGKVLLLPAKLPSGNPRLTFEPIFWCRYFFDAGPQTLGLLCNPRSAGWTRANCSYARRIWKGTSTSVRRPGNCAPAYCITWPGKTSNLSRITHRLGKKHALVGAQIEVLRRTISVAVVKPRRQSLRHSK